MEVAEIVEIFGYLAFCACMAVFIRMLVRLDHAGWVSRILTEYLNPTSMVHHIVCWVSVILYVMTFFFTISISSLTIYDPARMTAYLTNIFVPLWNSLGSY